MDNIGSVIRTKRIERGLSAADVASMLSRPISKQAFSNRERRGRFNFDMVVEIASILNCPLTDFHTAETTECCLSKKAQISQNPERKKAG